MTETTPKLRFPGHSTPWRSVPLGQLIERVAEPVVPDPDQVYREIGVRSHGRGIFHKDPTTGQEIGDKRVFRVIPHALVVNIVFAWEQAVGLTTDAEQGFIASHRFPMFRARDGAASLEFLRQFFLTRRGKAALELASPGGAGRNKTLGQSEFLKLRISAPEPAEQEKIAAALGQVNRKIALLNEQIETLQRYKLTTMDKVFRGELRFSQETGERYQVWLETPLEKLVCELRAGVSVNSADRMAKDGEFGVLKTSSIHASGFRPTENKAVTEKAEIDRLRESVVAGTIIVSRMTTPNLVGLSAFVPETFPNLFLPDRLWALHVKKSFSARWLSLLLSSPWMQRRIADRATGTSGSMKNLSKDALLSLVVGVPERAEQEKIAAFLGAVEDKIAGIRRQSELLAMMRAGLVERLFP